MSVIGSCIVIWLVNKIAGNR
ncbi:MAG: hypothetical protein LUC60_01265 [Lachnospiraceae bacterium]|nr:hypothetical protein [Lachnospiraceae bacterium]